MSSAAAFARSDRGFFSCHATAHHALPCHARPPPPPVYDRRMTPWHRVFAYGSNMDLGDVAAWFEQQQLGKPNVLHLAVGCLEGHRLVWNYRSPRRGAGAANVEPAVQRSVPGLLLEVDDATLSAWIAKRATLGATCVSCRRAASGQASCGRPGCTAWYPHTESERSCRRGLAIAISYWQPPADTASLRNTLLSSRPCKSSKIEAISGCSRPGRPVGQIVLAEPKWLS